MHPTTRKQDSNPTAEAKDFIEQHGDVLRRRRENEVTRGIQVAEPPLIPATGKLRENWQELNADMIEKIAKVQSQERQREMLADAIEGRTYTLKLRDQKQKEHILGTKEWERRRKDRESSGDDEHSVFLPNVNVRTLIRSNYGTGDIKASTGTIREYITVDTTIGLVYNKGTGEMQQTRRFVIEYGQKGIHAFPVKDW